MSTFTNWNGPDNCGDGNYIIRKKLEELANGITNLESQLGTYPGTTTPISNLRTTTLDVLGRINTAGLTSTGNIDAVNSAVNSRNLTVSGTATVQDITTVDATVTGTFEAKDIDVENIFSGPVHDFTKPVKLNVTCDHYYVIARLSKKHQDAAIALDGTTSKPGIVFLYTREGATQQLSALIQFTADDITVLYSKDNTITNLKFGLYKPADGYVYLAMFGTYTPAGGGSATLVNLEAWASGINIEFVTTISIPNGSLLHSETDCPNLHGFAVSSMDVTASTITNLTVNGIVTVGNNTITQTSATFPTLNTTNLNVAGDFKANEVWTNSFKDAVGHPIITVNETTGIVAGNANHVLNLIGLATRAKYNGEDVPVMSDILGAIEFMSQKTFFAYTLAELPIGPFPIDAAGNTIPVPTGATALVIANTTGPVALTGALEYTFNGTTWVGGTPTPQPPIDDIHTFQWVADYVMEGTDIFWHEADILWNPNHCPSGDPTVSIVNLPLENYLDTEEIDVRLDKIRFMFGMEIRYPLRTPEQHGNHDVYDYFKQTSLGVTSYAALPAVGNPNTLYYLTVADLPAYPQYEAFVWASNAYIDLAKTVATGYSDIASLPTVGDPTKIYLLTVAPGVGEAYTYQAHPIIQANWLDAEPTMDDPEGRLSAIHNPSFIQNKPITTMSILDGGNWALTAGIDWHYVIQGGDFTNVLGTVGQSLGAPDAYTTYPEVIFRLTHGPIASMPAASSDTQWMLKYATDSKELYIDSGNPTTPGSLNGNILLAALNNIVRTWNIITQTANPTAANNIRFSWQYLSPAGAVVNGLVPLNVAGFKLDGTTPRLTFSATTTVVGGQNVVNAAGATLTIATDDLYNALNRTFVTGITASATTTGTQKRLAITSRNGASTAADTTTYINYENFFATPNWATASVLTNNTASPVTVTTPALRGFVLVQTTTGVTSNVLDSVGPIPVDPSTALVFTGAGFVTVRFIPLRTVA